MWRKKVGDPKPGGDAFGSIALLEAIIWMSTDPCHINCERQHMPRRPDDVALPLKNFAFVHTLMENSQTAKVAGVSFAAGVVVGWFLHSFMLKVCDQLPHAPR